MARRRMIDPNIWISEDVSKLNIVERVLLIGMFSTADDYGKGGANLRLLKAKIFPYDSISDDEMELALNNIGKVINIIFYEVDGSKYYKFINWRKWQRVEHPRNSLIPEPLQNDSGKIPELVQNHSRLREDNTNEENVKEKEEEDKVDGAISSDKRTIDLMEYIESLKPGESISSKFSDIKKFIEDYGFDWTKEAIQLCISQKNRYIEPWIKKVLGNWKNENYNSNVNKKPQKKRNSFGDYSGQREYDMDKLRKDLLGRDTGG